MKVIQHIEVPSGGTTAIDFNPIVGDYDDLYITLALRSTLSSARDDITITVNGDTGASYSHQRLIGYDGTNKQSSGNSLQTPSSTWMFIPASTAGSDVFGTISIYIKDYALNDRYKTLAFQASATNTSTSSWVTGFASLWWVNSNPITSLKFESRFSTGFVEYSSATLYGIRKYNTSTQAPKATGGIISYDATNNNWVHTFTASGTFTPTENLTAEYLVIAGGGGTTFGLGGGGGAGGYRSSVTGELSGENSPAESKISLNASSNYSVVVGAGGAGETSSNQGYGGQGSDSSFAGIASLGGGRGVGQSINFPNVPPGQPGGSGSGGVRNNNNPGAGTTGQGHAGGYGSSIGEAFGGGGGGGAGGVGSNGSSTAGGNGGAGIISSITGYPIARAGGGGGTANAGLPGIGSAGGGNGGSGLPVALPSDGEPATGGGGGGGTDFNGRSGGSGVVIVRYAA